MSMSGAAVTSIPPRVDREVAREAVDPGAELEPALPVREADRGAATGLRRRLRLDPGDRRVAPPRRPGRRGAAPAGPSGWASELVHRAARRSPAAAARAGRSPGRSAGRRSSGGAHEPVPIGLRSRSRGPPAARRRWPGCRRDRPRRRSAARPDRRRRLGRALPHPRIAATPDGAAAPAPSGPPASQANGRGAFGSSGFGGWRQGGTFPTSGIRVFSWPIPSTRPSASAASAAPRLGRQPLARPLGRTRRTRRRPRGRAGP